MVRGGMSGNVWVRMQSDVQAVIWMCAPLGTHSVHVWTSLVCVPMCEAHTTHQLHSSNVSMHGVHTMEMCASPLQ